MIGIYKIENLINHKVYIGQSISIENRLKQHKSDLKNNRHTNSHLQSSWNKYGEENFIFEIIDLCTEEQLNEKEIYWIEYYGGKNNQLNFNQKDGGKFGSLNELSIEKIKLKTIGKHRSPKTEFKNGEHHGKEFEKGFASPHRKKVYQYDLDGKLIAEFSNISEAARMNGVSISLISLCCHNKIKTGKNYQWSFVKANKQKITKGKKVYQYDLEGKFIKKWNNVKEVADFMKVRTNSITTCCTGKNHTCRNYQWRYYYEPSGIGKPKTNKQRIRQYDLEGNLICEYMSLKQMKRMTGFDCSNVKRASLKNKISYGYYWKLIG